MSAMELLLVQVRDLAAQLPTGLADPRALEKLYAEQAELHADLAAGDAIGAVTEVADVAYYACKAVLNGLLASEQAWELIVQAAAACNLPGTAPALLITAKYGSRVTVGKDDDRERRAVVQLLVQQVRELFTTEQFHEVSNVIANWGHNASSEDAWGHAAILGRLASGEAVAPEEVAIVLPHMLVPRTADLAAT